MTRLEYATAIEKNRRKLLCLVFCWLMAAQCFARGWTRLPHRIGTWVHVQIFKAEAATGLLLIACQQLGLIDELPDNAFIAAANRHRAGLCAEPLDAPLTLTAIIARLKALRTALKNMPKLPQIRARNTSRQPFKLKPFDRLQTAFSHIKMAGTAILHPP